MTRPGFQRMITIRETRYSESLQGVQEIPRWIRQDPAEMTGSAYESDETTGHPEWSYSDHIHRET